jgi:hypothetical protein
MEGDNWEKLSIGLLVAGFIIGGIGGGISFLIWPWFAPLFYLGFLLVIAGFMIAVLHRVGKNSEK